MNRAPQGALLRYFLSPLYGIITIKGVCNEKAFPVFYYCDVHYCFAVLQ